MQKENITSEIVSITPAMAQMWLDSSKTKNRPLSQAVVNSYAETMKKGNWLVNGEAITFDANGNLLNGQHRLSAICNSGVTIESFVVRGVDKKVFTTFDCGRNRSFGQLITMQGDIHGNNVAAIVREYLVFKNGLSVMEDCNTSLRTLHETNKSMMDFFIRNKKFFSEITKKTISICGKARLLRSSFVGGSIAFLVRDCGYSEELAFDFFSQLCSIDTAENATINILRKSLAASRDSRKSRALVRIHSALAIKCWNAFVTRKDVKKFNWREEEGFPKYLHAEEIQTAR